MTREDIISEIERELDDVLAEAPESMSAVSTNEVKEELVGYAQRVLGALTVHELQNEPALQRFVETTVAQAPMRLHMR